MKSNDPGMRETQRIERLGATVLEGRVDVGPADAQIQFRQIDAIEFPRIADKRGVAIRDDVRDDRLNGLVDVLRHFPFHRKKRVERGSKIRAPRIEPQGHEIASLAGASNRAHQTMPACVRLPKPKGGDPLGGPLG
jgi:hypothetical protein